MSEASTEVLDTTATVLEPTPTIEPFKADPVMEAISEYERSYKFVQELTGKVSLKGLIRAFEAAVSFPFDEKAINRVKKGTPEFELFVHAISAIKARNFISLAVEHKTQQQEKEQQLNNNTVEETKGE
jgi:hypothetical protein